MPTYVYRREDGTIFEVQQRITEDALTVDPETGQKVTRVITGSAGLIFKGDGFYLTDYARQNGNGSGTKDTAPEGAKASSESASSTEGAASKESSSKSDSSE